MKKIILFLALFLCPLVANADTKNYYIEANILDNGDMAVKELKILDGEYNGVLTSLRYKNNDLKKFSGIDSDFEGSSIYNGSNLTDLKVYSVSYTDAKNFDIINQPLDEFELANNAYKGQYGVYTKYNTDSGVNLTIYMPSSYKYASLVTYVVKDAVVIHNDVAELAWDFIGSDYEEYIDDLIIKINLPGDSQELRVWSHGPLNGINKITTRKMLTASWDYLNAYTAVDVRVVFDKSLVYNGTKFSNVNGLDKILAVEKIRADKANQEREKANAYVTKIKTIGFSSSIIIIILTILFFIYVYNKYDKELKSTFKSKYYREFIDDYNVEVIDYLMKKSISSNAMSASILNLVYKKNISVEKVKNGKKDLYVFKLLTEDNVNNTEKELLVFLFERVGNNKAFTTDDLKSYAKSTNTYDDFTKSYTHWKNLVVNDGQQQQFYQNNTKIKVLGSLYGISAGIFSFFNYSRCNVETYLTTIEGIIFIVAIILPIIFFIYVLSFNKKTAKGNEHYLKWTAFKNFLNDFGQFKAKDLPEIILWERYLVYATIFGIAKKVQKEMNVKIKELNLTDTNNTFFNTWIMYDISNDIDRSVHQAISNSQATAAAIAAKDIASSVGSSAGGFGGGSSSGGGGFGGGGSGGGRF